MLEVKEQTDTSIILNLTIPENLYYFQGHFPQAAILPGVVQLDWVMYYLEQFFNVKTNRLTSVDALKFQHIIRPEYQVLLTLKCMNENKYSFSYQSPHGQHSSGKVVLA